MTLTNLATNGIAEWLVHTSTAYLVSIAYLSLLACMIVIERCLPNARAPSGSSMRFNITYTIVMLALLAALKPLAMIAPLTVAAWIGTGWLSFPATAWGWICSFLSLMLFADLLEYLFHRAQHTIPFLWRMHRFHHSAEHFDVTLAYRHFWLEPLLKTILIYPLPGLLLKSPNSVILIAAAIGQVFQYVAHMNVRLSPRALGLLVTHPQYHRVHHSRAVIHYNKNFCALLPLWDILFGTLHRPEPREFVDVGLEPGATPTTLWEALSRPLRPPARRMANTSAGKMSEVA